VRHAPIGGVCFATDQTPPLERADHPRDARRRHALTGGELAQRHGPLQVDRDQRRREGGAQTGLGVAAHLSRQAVDDQAQTRGEGGVVARQGGVVARQGGGVFGEGGDVTSDGGGVTREGSVVGSEGRGLECRGVVFNEHANSLPR